MEHLNARRWRKSSYSGNGGADYVEIGVDTGTRHVLVRDTKNCRGPVLEFTSAAWSSFAVQLKADARNHPSHP